MNGAGDTQRFIQSGLEGFYFRVKATSDGGFIGVGSTSSRPLLGYNPTSADPDGSALDCWGTVGPRRRIGFAAKYDAAGTLEWRFAYGMMDVPGDYFPGSGLGEQGYHEGFTDVVERADGGFRMVGSAAQPADSLDDQGNLNVRAVVVDVDASGVLLGRRSYGVPGWTSRFFGVARNGNTYAVAGSQGDGPVLDATLNRYAFYDVFAATLDASPAPMPSTSRLLTTTAGQDINSIGFGVEYSGNGRVLVGAVIDCGEQPGVPGQCGRFAPSGQGEGRVFALNPNTLGTLVSTSLGALKSYDLMVRLRRTADGGVAVISTKQPSGPIACPPGAFCGDAETNNTDAYVAKLNAGGALVWETTYAARTHKTSFYEGYDGYDKMQECLYDIVEASDGGLVIAGNNSANYDDSYLVRFGSADLPVAPGLSIHHQQLVYPPVVGGQTVATTGDYTVEDSAWLDVEVGTTVAFGPSAALNVEGGMDSDGATFTAMTPSQGWDGMLFLDGSVGTILDSVVDRVGGAPGVAGVTVFEASPQIVENTFSNLLGGADGIVLRGPNPTPELIHNVVDRIVVETDVTVPVAFRWRLLPGEVAFDPGTGLTVHGELKSEGVTFTASDPAQGWEGIRYEAGATGALLSTLVERVWGFGHYAVRVTDASPTFDVLRIRNPVLPSAVAGILITGSGSKPVLDEVRIEDMTYDGVVFANGARVRMTDGIVLRNDRGLLAGYGARAFLYPALDGARIRGNLFEGNRGEGLRATSGADVTLGYYHYPVTGIHNDGFNSFAENDTEGLRVSNTAKVHGGGSTIGNGRNRIVANGADEVVVSGTGSAVYGVCNWWDSGEAPPSEAVATGGAYLTVADWLREDPFLVPTAPCGGDQAVLGETRGSLSMTPLDAALALSERPAAALAALVEIVERSPTTAEGAAAMAAIGLLAERPGAPREALLYVEERADTPGPLQGVARRALVTLLHGTGDARGALAMANQLVAMAHANDGEVFELVAQVHLYNELGQDAEALAAYHAIEAAAPASVEARLAREYLGLPYQQTARAGVRAGTQVSVQAATEPPAFGIEGVRPNPTASVATVTFSLDVASPVRVSVHDVLGREVAVVTDGERRVGTHSVTVDGARLGAGVYLVRVVAARAGASDSRRFTVAR